MDVTKYMSGAYITAKDLGEEVRDETIADTRDGQYGKPELVFESKDKLSLNATNLKTMTKHYGRETNLWVGIVIRLVRGEATFNGNQVPSVVSCRSARPFRRTSASGGHHLRASLSRK